MPKNTRPLFFFFLLGVVVFFETFGHWGGGCQLNVRLKVYGKCTTHDDSFRYSCVQRKERAERDGRLLSSKILIFFKKKTKRKKNFCFLSSLSCVVPTFFKKAPSSSFIIDPIAEREREKERERKAAQNRRLFASSFFLKESFNNT